jgi:thioredoxin 2
MPAVIDPNVCDKNWAACFPAKMCPKDAFSFDSDANLVVIDDSLCGDCPGPCVNFCDQYAIRYSPDHSEFSVLKQRTLGELSEDEAADELERLKAAEKEQAEAEKAAEGATINATAETFNDVVLKSDLPVIVDFWAPWCGPCQQMGPVFEKLAEQYQGNIRFVKVNTDEEQQLAAQFQITSLPTTALFWQGQMLDTFAGALSERQLQSLAYQFLTAIQAQQGAAAGQGEDDDIITSRT